MKRAVRLSLTLVSKQIASAVASSVQRAVDEQSAETKRLVSALRAVQRGLVYAQRACSRALDGKEHMGGLGLPPGATTGPRKRDPVTVKKPRAKWTPAMRAAASRRAKKKTPATLAAARRNIQIANAARMAKLAAKRNGAGATP